MGDKRLLPSLTYEKRLWEDGYRHVAGLDEAGRGSWAGPVVAAAVILQAYLDRKDYQRDAANSIDGA